MSQSAWPTVNEVTTYVTGLGFTVPAGFDVQDEIDGAVEDLEELGYKPFKVDAADVTLYYDPPGDARVLYFRQGMVSITSLTVGYSTNTAGTALTVGEDYFLEPSREASDLAPYTRVRFMAPQIGWPGSIKIIGKRGYASAIPQVAWNAVRDRAAERIAVASLGGGGAVKRVKQGMREIEYESPDLQSLANSFKTKSARYHLLRVG